MFEIHGALTAMRLTESVPPIQMIKAALLPSVWVPSDENFFHCTYNVGLCSLFRSNAQEHRWIVYQCSVPQDHTYQCARSGSGFETFPSSSSVSEQVLSKDRGKMGCGWRDGDEAEFRPQRKDGNKEIDL